MADFYHAGSITTLHRLGRPKPERLMAELELYSLVRPIALVLRALFSDVMSEAMTGIREDVKGAKFIREIVLALGPATDDEFRQASEFMSELPQEVTILHTGGARMKELYRTLEESGVSPGRDGKGRSAWAADGCVLASGRARGRG